MIKKFLKPSIFNEGIAEIALKFLKYFLMFSFVLWLSIITWNAYSAYKAYKKIKIQQKEVSRILAKKNKVVTQYKQKLSDIQLAYNEISKVISPVAVQNLVNNLDKSIQFFELEKSNINIYIYNPYRITGFNITLKSPLPYYIQGVSLIDTNISPYMVSLFKQAIQIILTNWNKKRYKPFINIKVDVETNNNNILLYLKQAKKNTSLKIKPLIFYGVINNILQIPYFLTTTAVSSSFMSELNFSQFYIGWDIEFNRNKGGLK